MKISTRKFGILLIFFVFFLMETISVAAYQKATLEEKEKFKFIIEQEDVSLSKEEEEILNLVNEYRRINNLEELKPLSNLQDVSKKKGEDLVNNNYFSHISEELGTPFEMLEKEEIEYKIAGENLAGNISAKKAVKAWINSPSHNANLLEEKFEYTGICVIDSPVYGKVYVQIFIGI